MCAIFGSNKLYKLNELYKLNKHRGGHSFSIMGLGSNKDVLFIKQEFGEFTIDNIPTAHYYIAHIQAPTDGVGANVGIHPAHFGPYYLYHNGMIKFGVGEWDTLWLLRRIALNTSSLNIFDKKCLYDIDGSFACVLVNSEYKTIRLFTNDTCALFIKGNEISSTRSDGFKRINPCTIYDFDLSNISVVEEFENIDKTYFQRRKSVKQATKTKS